MWCLFFWVWLISFNIMISSCIYFVKISGFLCVCVCVYSIHLCISFIHWFFSSKAYTNGGKLKLGAKAPARSPTWVTWVQVFGSSPYLPPMVYPRRKLEFRVERKLRGRDPGAWCKRGKQWFHCSLKGLPLCADRMYSWLASVMACFFMHGLAICIHSFLKWLFRFLPIS